MHLGVGLFGGSSSTRTFDNKIMAGLGANNIEVEKEINSNRPSSDTPSGGWQLPPRRTSQMLGDGDLAKQMQHQQSESSDEDLEQQTTKKTERSLEYQKSERTVLTTQIMERTPREKTTWKIHLKLEN